ncbi:MAG TPA: biotin/lipoyl-binding protein, partial [Solirubrobacteraceae bacterium]|nr:biotin/lipoyl-binding protein [Solirubrobacteraceae bacterium]
MKLRQEEAEPRTLEAQADGRGRRRVAVRRDRGPEGRPTLASRFRERPVLNSLLVLGCIAVIVLAVAAVGPASSSSGRATRTATAKYGVVQSTVSGSGNIQSADQLNLGFKTSGTVTHIYVKQGQQVTRGQLLATLDPQSAEVSLEQAKATLQSAEANLAKLEEDEGETSSGQGASATAGTASTSTVAYATDATATTGSQTPTSTTPTTSTPATTTPSKAPSKATKPSAGQGSSTDTKQSAATREANLASARAQVKSDKLAVQGAEQAVGNTKLYAPQSGTIVTLSGEVGETVSGTGTTKASSSTSSSSSSSSSTGAGTGGKTPTGSTGAGTSGSSGGASSSSSFAVLSNLESLQLVVPLSESEIGSVHDGQIATVTIEALASRKVAAHVASVGEV